MLKYHPCPRAPGKKYPTLGPLGGSRQGPRVGYFFQNPSGKDCILSQNPTKKVEFWKCSNTGWPSTQTSPCTSPDCCRTSYLTLEMNFLGQVSMWSGFLAIKLNTRRERELGPNQAEHVPFPDPYQKYIWNFFISQLHQNSSLPHESAACHFLQQMSEKRGTPIVTYRGTPCISTYYKQDGRTI